MVRGQRTPNLAVKAPEITELYMTSENAATKKYLT